MFEFLTKYKKLIFIFAFLLLILILGYIIFLVFFKPMIKPVYPPDQAEPAPAAEGFPSAATGTGQIVEPARTGQLYPDEIEDGKYGADTVAQGGVTKIIKLNEDNALSASLSSDGSHINYYNRNDGKFYRMDNNGNAALLSDKIFHGAENVVWSNNSEKAIIEYPDGANIIYNFSNKKQITLPKHWKDFSFSSDDKQISLKSMGLDPDNRWLAVSSDDGTMARPIEPLGDKDNTVYPSWSPNKQSLAIFTESIGMERQNVYFVGQNNENFKSMVVEGRGFEFKWAPSQGRLLYSVYSSRSDLKPELWIANAEGEKIGTGRKNLNVNTWADKCVFAGNEELYCAVPRDLEAGAGMFAELADASPDELYKINTVTGLKSLVAIPDGTYNMSNLIISDNGYYLYFTNAWDNNLYKINLK